MTKTKAISVSEIRGRIFNTTTHEPHVARSSNPFSKVKLGNVLTADVFDSQEKNIQKYTIKDKLKASALVGSISDFGSKIRAGIESINAFGTRMKESIVNTWNKINDITIEDIGQNITKSIYSMFEDKSAKGLSKRPVSELRQMFKDAEYEISHMAA
ncbi:hypothetical protein IJF81_00500 [bacterium]|nr:hypothetical protein [bacterium]